MFNEIRVLTLREAINAQDSSPVKTYDNLLVVSSAITHNNFENLSGHEYQILSKAYFEINGDLDFEINNSTITFSDSVKQVVKPIKKKDFDRFVALADINDQITLFINEYITPTNGLDTEVKYLAGLSDFFREVVALFTPYTRK